MTAVAPASTGRLLRIEIKHSAVPWVLPLLAALFLYDPFRTASGYPAVWDVRASVVPNKMLLDFIPFTAAFAAWAGSREGRRRTADLLASTAHSAWSRQAAAFAATAALFVLPFLAGVTVLYIQTARVATWGGPPLWPVAVSVLTLIAVCAVGFTAGALFPGRFTAPLVTVGVVMLEAAAFNESVSQSGPLAFALLSPATAVPPIDSGVFYPVAPDLSIARAMFLGGVTVAVLGVLALAPVRGMQPGGIGRRARTAAIALVAAGVALTGTAFGLTATATHGVSGWDIPALHDAASDRPIPYTPVCAGTGLRVCMHPAFSYYLDDTAAALAPVAAEIAGLPGAPARGEEVNGAALTSTGGNGVITGNPPVYQFSMNTMLDLSGFQETNFQETFQQDLLDAFVAPGGARNADVNGPSYTPAQQAVVIALMQAAGSRPTSNTPFAYNSPINAQVAMTADRFAALPPAARHAWLAAHLTALQSGHITLEQLP
jgi:hypothetical protein